MSKSIKLSKKHGVNPTIGTCFYCGEPTGEMAFLGALPGDAKAPMYTTLNYTPCDKCKEKMSEGITVIECSYISGDRPAFSKDSAGKPVYPTGRWCVLRKEPAKEIFGLSDNVEKICVDFPIYENLMKAVSSDKSDC